MPGHLHTHCAVSALTTGGWPGRKIYLKLDFLSPDDNGACFVEQNRPTDIRLGATHAKDLFPNRTQTLYTAHRGIVESWNGQEGGSSPRSMDEDRATCIRTPPNSNAGTTERFLDGFKLTNDAVAESWLVRGYRDTSGDSIFRIATATFTHRSRWRATEEGYFMRARAPNFGTRYGDLEASSRCRVAEKAAIRTSWAEAQRCAMFVREGERRSYLGRTLCLPHETPPQEEPDVSCWEIGACQDIVEIVHDDAGSSVGLYPNNARFTPKSLVLPVETPDHRDQLSLTSVVASS
ncbi:hypothetical protein KM043_002136 [Ampulex compressa]|nr:hypothetical protein KM043_002136 [Ampulex compressa]